MKTTSLPLRPFTLKPTTMAESLVVRTGAKLLPVNASQIMYVEASGKLCIIKTAERDYYVRMPLQDLEKNLAGDSFVRTHRCYLISLRHIKEIVGLQVTIGSKTLPLSRKGRMELIRCYTLVQ